MCTRKISFLPKKKVRERIVGTVSGSGDQGWGGGGGGEEGGVDKEKASLTHAVRGRKTKATDTSKKNDSLSSRSEGKEVGVGGRGPTAEQPRCELFVVKCLVALF